MWKARQHKRAELRVGLDDKWKDLIMLGAVVIVCVYLRFRKIPRTNVFYFPYLQTIAAFVAQTYLTRREALLAQQERSTQRRLAANNRLLPGNTALSASENDDK